MVLIHWPTDESFQQLADACFIRHRDVARMGVLADRAAELGLTDWERLFRIFLLYESWPVLTYSHCEWEYIPRQLVPIFGTTSKSVRLQAELVHLCTVLAQYVKLHKLLAL